MLVSHNGLFPSNIAVRIEVLHVGIFGQDVVIRLERELYPLVIVVEMEDDVEIGQMIDLLRRRLDGGVVESGHMPDGTW